MPRNQNKYEYDIFNAMAQNQAYSNTPYDHTLDSMVTVTINYLITEIIQSSI